MQNRESDEDYGKVVGHLSGEFRIIECRDGIQWVTQTRYGERWRNKQFFRTRAGLELYHGNHPVIAALPDRFPCRSA